MSNSHIIIVEEDVLVNEYVDSKALKAGVSINLCRYATCAAVTDPSEYFYCLSPHDGQTYTEKTIEDAIEDILDGGHMRREEAKEYRRYEDEAFGLMD